MKNNALLPLVGIFWFYDGKPVFVHAVPLAEGLKYGDAITGIKDHAVYWEELRSQANGVSILPPRLREEYFSIPRGRVVYHQDTEQFTVYHGNNLRKTDLKKVAAAFHLPKDTTRFEQDFHYCDVRDDEWESMLGGDSSL